jgi:uncharacterized protein (TIGR02453 family)
LDGKDHMDFVRLTRYLAGLETHNDKAWFEANRAEYQALRDDFTAFVGELITCVAEWNDSVRWVDPKDCLFRIYRDVRFSRDKSPYKTTFAAAIGERGRRDDGPAYYLQVDAKGTLFVAGGLYMPSPDQLGRIRDHVVESPEAVDALLAAPGFATTFGEIHGERLKRPPRGYPDGVPHMELIKQKGFYVLRERDVSSGAADALAWTADSFRAMEPLFAWLREALGSAPQR